MTLATLLPGTEVEARGLRWEVVRTQQLGAQTSLVLRGLEGALAGQEFEVLSPFESVRPLSRELDPTKAAPLPRWLVYHEAFLLEQAFGADSLLAVDPGRVTLEPYQLVPVMRALRQSRVRLLLADGVGLGKTVEAGLILVELIARRVAHRILIVSPPGPLLDQWRTELREKFGLRFEEVDDATIKEVRRTHELGANPFDHLPLALASIDYLKQDKVREDLERAVYDIVVVDEAHHCFDHGASGERDDTQRRRLAEVLAASSDALLLLTATPHDGDDRSFASLCELLDPSLVDGRGVLRGDRYEAHVVRRLRDHIRDPLTGQPRFPQREVLRRQVRFDDRPKFAALQKRLLGFALTRIRSALARKRFDEALSFFTLLKRGASTAAATAKTLGVIQERLERFLTEAEEADSERKERIRSLRELRRTAGRVGASTADAEGVFESLLLDDVARQLAEDEKERRRATTATKREAATVAELAELRTLAEAALEDDPKLARLAAEIAAIRAAEPDANVLVFTEYVDSQTAAVRALKVAKIDGLLTLRGDDDAKARAETLKRFTTESGLILVSTDTAAEGLNLQRRCHHLIHLELPFNPNRLEQRSGRIDRYGQKLAPCVRYLYLAGTFEERLLIKLVSKWERQRSRLKYVPNTLGISLVAERTDERLLSGLMEDEASLFKAEEPVRDLSADEIETASVAGYRDLMNEMEGVLGRFDSAAKSHQWLSEKGLNADATLVAEAGAAVDRGRRALDVDLLRFVENAVVFGGGTAQRPRGKSKDGHVLAVKPPASWGSDLAELAGEDGFIRLTGHGTMPEIDDGIAEPPEDSVVQFLGRAHPLVRRALDRVRTVSYGGAAGAVEDPRVSAVAAAVPRPEMLFTFAGRVTSAKGREWERLLAVRVREGRAEAAATEPATWFALADRSKAIRTADVWKTHFPADDLGKVTAEARSQALSAFAPLAASFSADRRRALEAERRHLDAWLKARTKELTADVDPSAAERTGDLFVADALAAPRSVPNSRSSPAWRNEEDAFARLCGFAADPAVRASLRHEAEVAVKLFKRRSADLEARLALRPAEVQLIGLLMLIPESARGD